MVKVNRIDKSFLGNINFFEDIDFNENIPYCIFEKEITKEEIVPMHFAPSIEILLCQGLEGYVTMSNYNFHIKGDCVFVISPGVVHGTTFRSDKGKKTCLMVSPSALRHYVDIEHVLSASKLSIDQLSSSYNCYDEVNNLVKRIIDHDGDFLICINTLLSIFETLLENVNHEYTFLDLGMQKNTQLQKLLNWTNQNIGRKIDLNEAASTIGYSKSYFCKYFKSIAGMTYVSFLQKIRVAKAEVLLRQGWSVSDCCNACGYENISYFIQLFRKHTGKSMLRYKRDSLAEE